MVIALVAKLENFHKNLNWHTRGICISALIQLVNENEKIFQEEDNLAAIWNLFFLLGAVSHISPVVLDRIVIIQGLGILAHMYAKTDTCLASNVIESLLKLDIKVYFFLLID